MTDLKLNQSNTTLKLPKSLDTKPFWMDPEDMPHFIKRTDVQYATLPAKSLLDQRGLSNRLLDSFLDALPVGAIIAGGFMTSVMQNDKNAKDIDFFFTCQEAFDKTLKNFMEGFEEGDDAWAYNGYKPDFPEDFFKNTNAYRFVKFNHPTRPPVQLVKLVWYEDPSHVIDTFDFTISQFAAFNDGKESKICFNPISPMDLTRKHLVLHRMQFPASTMRRLIKYAQKGYYACPGALEKIATETQKILTSNPEVNEGFVYVD